MVGPILVVDVYAIDSGEVGKDSAARDDGKDDCSEVGNVHGGMNTGYIKQSPMGFKVTEMFDDEEFEETKISEFGLAQESTDMNEDEFDVDNDDGVLSCRPSSIVFSMSERNGMDLVKEAGMEPALYIDSGHEDED
jgi:hypothetical protein